MSQNLWRAGVVGNIYSAGNWSNGAPAAGETLLIGAGTATLSSGNAYGDTVVLSAQSSAKPAILAASGTATASVLVQQQVYPSGAPGGGNSAYGTINVSGTPQVSLEVLGAKQIDAHGTVVIAANSQMRGGFTAPGSNATVTIQGGATSSFANTASSLTGYYDVATIDANVVGTGSFTVGFLDSMTFKQGVASGQTIADNGGSLTIADPHDFHGAVNWSPTASAASNFIALSGLNADHSTYHNGVLSLTSAGHDVFDFHVQATGNSTVVAAHCSGGMQVYASAADAAAAGMTPIAHS